MSDNRLQRMRNREGVAKALGVEVHRVEIQDIINQKDCVKVDIRVDGRDLTPTQVDLILKYFKQGFQN